MYTVCILKLMSLLLIYYLTQLNLQRSPLTTLKGKKDNVVSFSLFLRDLASMISLMLSY